MPPQISRTTHQIDAQGRPAGRLATEISRILMGKHKPGYVPHLDVGDTVEILNVSKMSFSGKKMERNVGYHHTGWLGGLKTERLKDKFARSPSAVLRDAVSRMLPKNTLRTGRLRRLVIIKES
ncbi:50S ribosomal protein L13 [Candidatus Uhrbacteria bacterium]|nr:50S ribosomal protein L13 [Candidatus Uhrbacteria bacterium]